MEYLTAYNMTDPKLHEFTQAMLQRINFEAPQDRMGTRVKVLMGLYLASLQKTGITLRELRAFIDKDLSTIWRHIAEFEEAGIAIQVKRGKWTLTHPTLTATIASALDRVINEFNIALAYAKNIDEKFHQTTTQTLPIWVKLWIKPLAFTNTSEEENTITTPNQAPPAKTTTKTARPTLAKANAKERQGLCRVAGLSFWFLFGNWGVFVVFYFLYDYSCVSFSGSLL
jgi:hypothetical protein